MHRLRLIYAFCSVLAVKIDGSITNTTKEWKPDKIINGVMAQLPKDHEEATGQAIEPLNVINGNVSQNVASYIIGNGDKKYRVRIRKKMAEDNVGSAVSGSVDEAKNEYMFENGINANKVKQVESQIFSKNKIINTPEDNICSVLNIRYQDIWLLAQTYFGLDINKSHDLKILMEMYNDFILYLEMNTVNGKPVLLFSIKDFLESDRLSNVNGKIVYKPWTPSNKQHIGVSSTKYITDYNINDANHYQGPNPNEIGGYQETNYLANIPSNKLYLNNRQVNGLENKIYIGDPVSNQYDNTNNLIDENNQITQQNYKTVNDLGVIGNHHDMKLSIVPAESPIALSQVRKDITSPSQREIYLPQYSEFGGHLITSATGNDGDTLVFPITNHQKDVIPPNHSLNTDAIRKLADVDCPCKTKNIITDLNQRANDAIYAEKRHDKFEVQTDVNNPVKGFLDSRYGFDEDGGDSDSTDYGVNLGYGNEKRRVYRKGTHSSAKIFSGYQYPYTGENRLYLERTPHNIHFVGGGNRLTHGTLIQSPVRTSLTYYQYPNVINEGKTHLENIANEEHNFRRLNHGHGKVFRREDVLSPSSAQLNTKLPLDIANGETLRLTPNSGMFKEDVNHQGRESQTQKTDEFNSNLTGRRSFDAAGLLSKLGILKDMISNVPSKYLIDMLQTTLSSSIGATK